ncbi:ABC transporter substrate-binding protein [Catellatospora tritici]|uniref:ABC transporter substrate-binding protein n=1 Tax=Catellatospora tritici TaxID=2851566 RepID=UPI001C2CE170|nr:ABC transporter substrate-binding protein [Catellatospora tritici]MBV1855582.1 ABC transporter substrate-binding protein [Catellatospora tritici]
MSSLSRRVRPVLAALSIAVLALTAACANPEDGGRAADPSAATKINTAPEQNRVRAERVQAIADLVPAAISGKGELAVGTISNGVPPLAFLADDDKTVVGVEIDIAQLVADTLGLKLTVTQSSWENLFLSIRSGKYDVGFSNITVTEERKDIYDFATYRADSLTWEVAADSKITKIEKPADVAGLTVGVGSGSNQEKVLLAWLDENKAAKLPETKIQYYQTQTDYWLALKSGRIEAFFGPHSLSAYHVQVAKESKLVGDYYSPTPALIGAMTVKDNGLIKALNEALNSIIANGKYAEVLARWGLDHEKVTGSLINPPGTPRKK